MIRPSKKLGQNFLKNQEILAYIAKSAEISADDTVIEVGAGTGLLTEYLAKTGAKVIAVEKDKNLVPFLKNKFKNQKNATIIYKDILKFNPRTWNLEPGTYNIVGNIPYYLTSHLLKKILTEWPNPKLTLFMVQKEVAQRIVAKPPEISLLALSVQLYADAEILKYVPKENFWPMPKVDSALVKILPKNLSSAEKVNIEKILELARIVFSGKRKQLLNSLSAGLKLPRAALGSKLEEAGIDGKRRPETLTLNEWEKLSKILSSQAGYSD